MTNSMLRTIGARVRPRRARQTQATASMTPTGGASNSGPGSTRWTTAEPAEAVVDLQRRRDALSARVAELQWDLGGLLYEMAIRDHIRTDVLVRRAATMQEVDAELSEVERILRIEQTGTAGTCASCSAPHSGGAVYCWQCGQPLMALVPSEAISR